MEETKFKEDLDRIFLIVGCFIKANHNTLTYWKQVSMDSKIFTSMVWDGGHFAEVQTNLIYSDSEVESTKGRMDYMQYWWG